MPVEHKAGRRPASSAWELPGTGTTLRAIARIIRHVRRFGPCLAAAALAVYWTFWALAAERVFGEPSWLRGLIYDDIFFVLGVVAAIIVAAYVGRWWVLLVAVTPIGVWAGLETAGHVAPYHEAEPPLTKFVGSDGWWPVFWLYMMPLALGVILRKGMTPWPRPNAPRRDA